jgi:hypothetical protein
MEQPDFDRKFCWEMELAIKPTQRNKKEKIRLMLE